MKRYDNIEQRSEAWHQIRKGKITGTTLKAIMGTPAAKKDAIYELIAERLTVGVDTDYENPMDRGVRLEPEAIATFEFETGLKVEETGFCENDDIDSIAYSPDGLIGDTEDVEVKCMGGKNHVKMWLTNEVPKDYKWQVIQAFVVNEKLQKRYFVGYNPDIPLHPLHIIEVKREDVQKDIDKALEAQQVFLKEVENVLVGIINFE